MIGSAARRPRPWPSCAEQTPRLWSTASGCSKRKGGRPTHAWFGRSQRDPPRRRGIIRLGQRPWVLLGTFSLVATWTGWPHWTSVTSKKQLDLRVGMRLTVIAAGVDLEYRD